MILLPFCLWFLCENTNAYLPSTLATGLFSFGIRKVKINYIIEHINVIFHPLGKVVSFMLPHFPQTDSLDSAAGCNRPGYWDKL